MGRSTNLLDDLWDGRGWCWSGRFSLEENQWVDAKQKPGSSDLACLLLERTFSKVIPLLQHISNCQKRGWGEQALVFPTTLYHSCTDHFQYKFWISWHASFPQIEIRISIHEQYTLKISFTTSTLKGMVKISKDNYSDEYPNLLKKCFYPYHSD